jgi:hypothetical protein
VIEKAISGYIELSKSIQKIQIIDDLTVISLFAWNPAFELTLKGHLLFPHPSLVGQKSNEFSNV